jgi:hypothetical protein
VKGDIQQSSLLFKNALERSESSQLRNQLHIASVGLATIQAALGNMKESRKMLNKYIPLFNKHNMKTKVFIQNILLNKVTIHKRHLQYPFIHILYLLQNSKDKEGYQKAFGYAQKHYLVGYLHRTIVFFPHLINALIKQGKPTRLTRTIHNFPVFKKETPVFSVNFLGDCTVTRNQKEQDFNLSPKDTAFLIYIATVQEKEIPLEKLFDNFWAKSKNSARNLSHLLVRLRKALKIPSHLFYVKENLLFNECYFRTDYDMYQEHLSQAIALQRAGEWGYAKREFLRAFELFRGEPFRKMYDDWSDDKRLEVLFSYESEVINFVKELIKRGRKKEAQQLIQKTRKITPDSDELEGLLVGA